MNERNVSIKAVTFDLWQTLLFETDGADSKRMTVRSKNLSQATAKLGIGVTEEQFRRSFGEMISWLESIWDADNEVTHVDQLRYIMKVASPNSLTLRQEWIEQLSSAYTSAIFDVPPYLNPDAEKTLQQLKECKKHIGLICNTGLTPGFSLRDFLAKNGVAKYFDVMLFSDEVGFRKPKPEIFQLAAQKMQIKPHEIAHVGDNLRSDIWGAKNAGFKAIHISTDVGLDKIAEADPRSLMSISFKPMNLKKDQMVPDKTVTSLVMVTKAVQELEM